MMETVIERSPVAQIETDALVLLEFEGKRSNEALGVAAFYEAGEIKGKSLEMTLLHQTPGFKAKRILLAGAGKWENFTSAEMRKVAAAAVRHLKSKSVRRVIFSL